MPLIVAALCSLCSCQQITDDLASSETEQVMDAEAALKQALQERDEVARRCYEESEFIFKVYTQLNEMSDQLSILSIHNEVSHPNSQQQMQCIQNRLARLNDDLRRKKSELNPQNKLLLQQIDTLQQQILNKEKLIAQLMQQIEKLKDDNGYLQTVVDELGKQLTEVNQKLGNKQASHYEEMADQIRQVIISTGGVNGSGNLRTLKKAQIDAMQKVRQYYDLARRINPSRELDQKIRRTENGIADYSNSRDIEVFNF